MALFLIYIIKSSICLTLFYLFFLLIMRSSTFFRFNRLTLLSGTLICLLLPFSTITVSEGQWIQTPIQTLSKVLTEDKPVETFLPTTDPVISRTSIQEKEELRKKEVGFPFARNPVVIISIVYLTGMLITLGLILSSFFRMWQIIKQAPRQRENGYWLLVVPQGIHSFSFGKYIILSEEDYQKNPIVLTHEEMHLRYRHTLDLLGFLLITIVHWFNPLVWLIRMEMQQLHEFEADAGVIKQGIDATQYQLLLVKKAVGTRLYSMANGFNHRKLKKRITMMLKERTNRWARLKLLLVVPVAMGVMFAFARPEVKRTVEGMIPAVQQNKAQPQDLIAMRNFFHQEAEKNKMTLQEAKAGLIHVFCINQRNEILFNGKIIKYEDIRKMISEAFINTAFKHERENEKHAIQSLIINYDINSNEYLVYKYLCEIKWALEQLPNLAKQANLDGSQEQWPILVFFENPRSFKREARIKKYTNIEVTLFENDKAITLKDFTENELRDKFVELKRSAEDIATVQLKLKPNVEMREVDRIKELLRMLYYPPKTKYSTE